MTTLTVQNIWQKPALAAGTTSLPEFVMDAYPVVIQPWIMRELVLGNLLKKNPGLESDVDPDEEAAKAFFAGEQRCLSYNTSFAQLLSNPRLAKLMRRWRALVYRVMGSAPKPLRFDVSTSGATTNLSRGNSPLERFSQAEITAELLEFILSFGPPTPFTMWDLKKATVVLGSKSVFVKKTNKVSRLVNPEAAINASIQRELGLNLNRRCAIFGIRIEDGQERHRDMAWLASILGHLATDDQSNASGHVYTALVEWLTPPAWFTWLNAARSRRTLVPRSPLKDFEHYWELQTFATMGNGFCFELETILFYTLIWACAGSKTDVSVFGDDCIYPVEHVPSVHKAFKAVGFVINTDKSFSSGSFRESCGGDFLNGHNVRPLYLKRSLTDAYDLTLGANQALKRYLEDGQPVFLELYEHLVSLIPEDKRLYGPQCMGDIVLHTTDPTLYKIEERGAHKRQSIRVWKQVPTEMTSFGKLVHRGVSPDLATRIVSNGNMRGWGLVHRKTKDKKEEVVYAMQPAPGTRYQPTVGRGAFFTVSNSVDETKPLSVFDFLKNTKALPRLYSKDYLRAVSAEKQIQLSKLALLLGKLQEKHGTFNAFSIDVDF